MRAVLVVSPLIRIATLLIVLTLRATSLLAVSIVPNLERSAAVLTGTVLSVRKFVLLTNSGGQKEIWTAAEVRVEHIGKKDTNLSERVFLYFEQAYRSESGF